MNTLRIYGYLSTLVLLLSAGAAEATTMYEYSATCSSIPLITSCAVVGLSEGDPVNGTIEFDETNFAPNAVIGTVDVVAFELTFGTLQITDSTAAGFGFFGVLAPDAVTFSDFAIRTSEALAPALGDIILANGSGHASPEGNCVDSGCFTAFPGFVSATFTAGSLTRATVAVPEPGTIALLALGLSGLAYRRSKQDRRASRRESNLSA